jgi:hypothetical protein
VEHSILNKRGIVNLKIEADFSITVGLPPIRSAPG